MTVSFVIYQLPQKCPSPQYLLDPHDGVVKLSVYGLQVFECGFLVQHSFVEWQCKASVNELAVVQSLQTERFLHKPQLKLQPLDF